MTPFGIRKRIKSLVFGASKGGGAYPTIEVEFVLPDGTSRRVRTEPQYTLSMASQLLETPIDTPCPDGHCGNCQVRVLADAGGLAAPSTAERQILDDKLGPDRDPAIRLACHARLLGEGVRVEIQKVWSLDSIRGTNQGSTGSGE